MATIRLDNSITSFIRKVSDAKKFGDGTMSSIVENAIMFMSAKHDECFACKFHMDQVAGLELGRQKMALNSYANGKPADAGGGEWVVVSEAMLKRAKEISARYRRPMKHVVEQAVLEHLTRPPNCASCPFYAEMCQKVYKEKME